MSNLAKYFGEQDNRYGNHLTWPGTAAGYPVRGHVSPMMKAEEFEELDHAAEFKCRMFRTWDPEDMRQYQWVMDRVVNQFFVLRANERRWSDDNRGYFIWVEWAEVYGVAPDADSYDPLAQLAGRSTPAPRRPAVAAITGRDGHA